MAVTEQPKPQQNSIGDIEIDLREVRLFIRNSTKTVLISVVLFSIIGLIYAYSLPNEYTASVRVMPELEGSINGGSLGEISSLAGLAGVNLGPNIGSETIRPDLYPDILRSTSFTMHLLDESVLTTDSKKIQTLRSYMAGQPSGGFLNLFKGEKILDDRKLVNTSDVALDLTPEQEAMSDELTKRITITTDKKNGIITLLVSMYDPKVAAITAGKTVEYLSNYVTNYRTAKARQQVNFLSKQVNTARKRYQESEFALSNYRDKNRSLFLNTAKIEEQHLQAEYTLAQEVYNNLSRQLEQAKIRVQEESPVFQVLEHARLPSHKSGPKRSSILVTFIITGAFVGFVAFFIRQLNKRNTL